MIDYRMSDPWANWLWRYRWIFGRPAELWMANQEIIEKFVDAHQLRPVDRAELAADDPIPIGVVALPLAEASHAETPRWLPFPPRPFPGGLRIPHLHFKGEFYRLNDDEWAEFSRLVVDRFHSRLDRAGAIGFEKLLRISSEIEGM